MILHKPDYQAGISLAAEHLKTARGRLKDDLRTMQAGFKAEEQMAHKLGIYFADDARALVINDLRLELQDRVAQIDHLVLTRRGVYLIESKSISEEIVVNQNREWFRVYKNEPTPIDSPVIQSEQHEKVLIDFMYKHLNEFMTKILGLTKQLGAYNRYHYVAISEKGRIGGEGRDLFADTVMKYDQVVSEIAAHIKKTDKGIIGSLISSTNEDFMLLTKDELKTLGQLLVDSNSSLGPEQAVMSILDRYSSSRPATPAGNPAMVEEAEPSTSVRRCKHCRATEITVTYGHSYYIKCAKCDGNTPIKEPCPRCGVRAKIRKDGDTYHLACAACGDVGVYWQAGQPAAPVSDTKACPECGGDLVERVTKKGPHKGEKFLGCSNYPKCRMIQKLG